MNDATYLIRAIQRILRDQNGINVSEDTRRKLLGEGYIKETLWPCYVITLTDKGRWFIEENSQEEE